MARNLLLVVISISLTLLACEFTLQQLGYFPGFLPKNKKFGPVEKLEVYEQFLTDRNGLFLANPEWDWDDSSISVNKWDDSNISINSEGFRSDEFSKDIDDDKLSILFLGDSFTWGAAAKPLGKSYVDTIKNQNYITYNTGIPGTGPRQYARLAQKYIPSLKPDIVAVMFCMANDLPVSPHPIKSYQNLYHITNAGGWMYAFGRNGYMGPKTAYEYYLVKNNLITHNETNMPAAKRIVKDILLQTVIGTHLWGKYTHLESANKTANYNLTNKTVKHKLSKRNTTLIRSYLREIKTLSKDNNAQFMLFLIPNHPERKESWKKVKNTLHVFKGFNPYVPDFLQTDDYMMLPNGHFNNSGHRKYAQFIHQSITALPQ